MESSLDNIKGQFLVLINAEGQYSLWPAFKDVPGGWRSDFGPAGLEDCRAHIEDSWTDLRPASLVASMRAESDSVV